MLMLLLCFVYLIILLLDNLYIVVEEKKIKYIERKLLMK